MNHLTSFREAFLQSTSEVYRKGVEELAWADMDINGWIDPEMELVA